MAFEFLQAAAIDLNGNFRGKRLLGRDLSKAQASLRMPFSALVVDVTGADIVGSPLVFDSGDQDGLLRATDRGPIPLPWLESATALVPLMMYHEDGRPFLSDARQALVAVLERYAARGWSVVAATELEFTLVDDTGPALTPPPCPMSGRALSTGEVLSVTHLDSFDGYLTDLARGAAQMGIEIGSITSESGVGQFEVTLQHGDALRAADNTALFKLLARGMARRHSMAATFMAKPFEDDVGNGLHMHFSVLDDRDENVFDNGRAEGSDLLRQAVAGCLATMPDASLIFAPYPNSYERLVPETHAPTGAGWGYENRTAAIRIPGGPSKARRIEHRVAGGDTNPYLVFATVLGGALDGIARGLTPPDPIVGNAYDHDLPQLASDLSTAIERLSESVLLSHVFDPTLLADLARTKAQDLDVLTHQDGPTWPLLLETV